MRTSKTNNIWVDGFLDTQEHKSYLRYWADHIVADTGGSKNGGGWPYISDLFLLSQEVLQEEKETNDSK